MDRGGFARRKWDNACLADRVYPMRRMKIDWWLTGFCSARAFSQIITMTYAAALPVLQKEWDMSAAQAGAISSGFQLGYGISLLFVSILADRFGAKRLYLISMTTGALFTAAFALYARSYLSAFILYTLVALFIGGSYTTGLMILSDQYPVRRRGMATGFYIASSSLGYMVSLILSGFALPAGGYRLSFYLTCLATILGAVFSWSTLARTTIPVIPRQTQQSFRKEVLSNKPAMLLISAYTFHCWELLGMWAWAPAFLTACLVRQGAADLHAAGHGAYLAAIFHMAGIAASFSMGSLSDRLGRAQVIMVLAGLSVLCSFVFGWSIEWPFWVVIGLGLFYAFTAIGDSPVLSAALTEVVSISYLGSALGMRSILGFGAGALSPFVFGAILDWTNSSPQAYTTWGWAFVSLGIPGLGALWAASRLRPYQSLQP
ncbi:MAG: MFS transporter [Deltaproteobacteria bacterium]|nr:MFS transporter [Deltaproteobacteria bacterium]